LALGEVWRRRFISWTTMSSLTGARGGPKDACAANPGMSYVVLDVADAESIMRLRAR
jgi:hypothetical protein